MNKSLETLFDHLGCLYKFHQRPMTYLYNTLHYYEDRLRDRAALRKKIVASITDTLKEVRPVGWTLTQEIQEKYLCVEGGDDNCPWAAIASLALHKLYTDWQSQGYTLPKVQHISLAPIKTRETFLRNLRICQWTLLAAEEEEGAQVFLMLTKMLSRCIFLFLFSPVYPHTLQNILHQFFHCCDCNIFLILRESTRWRAK